MFWGLIMEPERRYTQHVKKSFHISAASLDNSSADNGEIQVMCGYEGRNYLMCTLKKAGPFNQQLDLNFEMGKEVSFATNGKGHVHLTGYLVDDEQDLGDLENLGSEEEEEESDIELNGQDKGNKKKRKISAENGRPAKKNKLEKIISSEVVEEEESDDSDFELNEEDDEEGDEEGEEEAEAEEDDEEEDDGEEEESTLSDEEEQPAKQQPLSKNQQKKLKLEQKTQKNEKPQQKKAQKKTVQGGVIIEDLKEGTGKPASNGRVLNVYYEGRLQSNNKVFDATKQGKGFSFKLGGGQVIKAWDVGMAGMKVGGKRRITCPPGMAYGKKGSPPTIPANSTLVFDVELKKIN